MRVAVSNLDNVKPAEECTTPQAELGPRGLGFPTAWHPDEMPSFHYWDRKDWLS